MDTMSSAGECYVANRLPPNGFGTRTRAGIVNGLRHIGGGAGMTGGRERHG